MAYALGDIVVKLKADTADLEKGLKNVQTKVEDNGQQIRNTFNKIAVAVTAVGAGITVFAKSATDYTVGLARDTKKLSRETGLAYEQASQLAYVTKRMGIDADQSSKSFGIFSKKITEAANSVTGSSNAISDLGVKVRNTDGSIRDFGNILFDVADKFKALPDGPLKTSAALDLFGRSGKDMIKVLNLGSQGIKDLEQRANDLGLTLTAKTIASVSKYIASQKDLKDSTNSLKVAIGSLTIPVLTSFNQHLNSILTTLISSSGPFRNVIAYIGAFGGPVLSASGALIGLGANMVQIAGSLGRVLLAFRAVGAFLLGPWGLTIAAAAALIGGLTYLFTSHNQATNDLTDSTAIHQTAAQDLNDTLEAQARDIDYLTQLTHSLSDSQFDAEGASLAVEDAQKNYNQSVKDYGPASLEARDAAHNLEGAKRRLQDANEKVAAAQKAENDQQAIMTQSTGPALTAIDQRTGKVYALRDALQSALSKFQALDLGLSKNITSGGLVITSAAHRASGGPVHPLMSYLVGESGQELFVPNTAGTIIPNNITEKLMNSTNTKNTNIYGDIKIDSPQDADYFFNRIDRNSVLESRGLSPI